MLDSIAFNYKTANNSVKRSSVQNKPGYIAIAIKQGGMGKQTIIKLFEEPEK